MMFLRLLCLLAGMAVLVAPPALLYPNGGTMPDLFKAGITLAGLLVAASGFFFIGISGHRMRRSPSLRLGAGLLLALPLAGCLGLLWRGGSASLLSMSSAMLCLIVMLYLSFIWPVVRGPGHRRMRARETCELQLNALPRY